MGWTGRAPAPNGSQSAPGACQERSPTMPRTTTLHAVTAIGIDMGKNTLHLIGLDTRGAIVLREKVARGRIDLRLANLPPCHADPPHAFALLRARRERPSRVMNVRRFMPSSHSADAGQNGGRGRRSADPSLPRNGRPRTVLNRGKGGSPR